MYVYILIRSDRMFLFVLMQVSLQTPVSRINKQHIVCCHEMSICGELLKVGCQWFPCFLSEQQILLPS